MVLKMKAIHFILPGDASVSASTFSQWGRSPYLFRTGTIMAKSRDKLNWICCCLMVEGVIIHPCLCRNGWIVSNLTKRNFSSQNPYKKGHDVSHPKRLLCRQQIVWILWLFPPIFHFPLLFPINVANYNHVLSTARILCSVQGPFLQSYEANQRKIGGCVRRVYVMKA